MVTAHPHRLTDASFTALAGGRADAATLAELRRAQLSRHLLLLRGIVRAAPAAGRWYEQLAAAERRAPGPVREVLQRPLVGGWAAGCLAALQAGVPPEQADVRQLAVLAALAEERAGPAEERAGPAEAGVGPAEAGGGPAAAAGGARADPDRRLTAHHDGVHLAVRLEDADPLRARLGLTPTGRLTDAELAHWADCLQGAWRLLVTRHRSHAQVIRSVLTCIVPVEADAAARGISASSADAFGAVAMSAPQDAVSLAVGLLHETQHSVLNAVQYLFDLVQPHHGGGSRTGVGHAAEPAGRAPLLYSPWRDDPRPAAGLLHGAYAYLAVTDFWREQRRGGDAVAQFEFARWRAAVLDATGDLLHQAALTPAGTRFVGALRDRVLRWRAEPVAPTVLALAEGANVDHRVRWRLRNLTVDAAAVAALTAAWQAARPPDPGRVGTTVRAATRRSLESSPRLELTHRLLRGTPAADAARTSPGPGGAWHRAGGTAIETGDAAYVRGDSAAAVAAYRRVLAVDPHHRCAWAGLALATGEPALRERPEVVAAVHRALPAGTDPVALAVWLG